MQAFPLPDSLQLKLYSETKSAPHAASFRCVLDGAPSVIQVECPNERFAPRVAHEPRRLQHRSHAVWRVNKGPKFLTVCQHPGVFQHSQGPDIPTVLGISEREQ